MVAAGRAAQRIHPAGRPNEEIRPLILVVEDEPAIAEAIEYGLQTEGFGVHIAYDGLSGWEAFQDHAPDLVVLDLMLPGLPGSEICRRIRAQAATPVIMLSAKDSEIDKVLGLELGADDYMTKPFSVRELIARIRAVLRRVSEPRGHDRSEEATPPSKITLGEVHLDLDRHEVLVRGEAVDLPPKEFALLTLLLTNAGNVLTREVIIDRIWGVDYVGDTKTLDVHIKRLRGRIEADPKHPALIQTIRGVGYKFVD